MKRLVLQLIVALLPIVVIAQTDTRAIDPIITPIEPIEINPQYWRTNGSYLYNINSNRVGIGTSSPNRNLTIYSGGSTYLNVKGNNGQREILVGVDQSQGIVSTMTNHDLHLRAGGNQTYMAIKTDGKVGIGTTTPSYKLQTDGDIYANGGWFRVSGPRGIYFQSYGGGLYMTDNTWIRTYGSKNFYHNTGIMRTDGTFHVGNGGSRFIVNTAGNVGVGETNPSEKLDVNGTVKASAIKFPDGSVQTTASGGGSGNPTGIYRITSGIHSYIPSNYSIIEIGGSGIWVGGISPGVSGQTIKIKVRSDSHTTAYSCYVWNEYNNAPENNKIQLNANMVGQNSSLVTLERGQSMTLYYDGNVNKWLILDTYDDSVYGIHRAPNSTGHNIQYVGNGTHRTTSMYYNSSYKNISIGYSEPYNVRNPDYKLDVNGAINATSFLVNGVPISGSGSGAWQAVSGGISYNSGNVGLGTNSPNEKLHILGPTNGRARVKFEQQNGPFAYTVGIDKDGPNNEFFIKRNGDSYFTVLNSYNGDKRLILGHAQGKVIVNNELCVSSPGSPCPDYVFEDNYELRTIEELEAFITENKHLPNVRSAKEIDEQGGVNFVEMSYSLLEKVEELTLYTIQQEKALKKQEQVENELRAELELLKKQVQMILEK